MFDIIAQYYLSFVYRHYTKFYHAKKRDFISKPLPLMRSNLHKFFLVLEEFNVPDLSISPAELKW